MSFTPNPVLVPDRDSLPLAKRDQRPGSPLQQQQCDTAIFKVPYPHRSHSEFKTKHTGPFQPVPRRVPALYQPWIPTQTSTRFKPHVLSAFREHHGWAEWREFTPLYPGWDFSHHYQHPSHFSGTPAVHPGHPQNLSRFSPISLVSEGFHRMDGGYDWEQLKTLRDKSKGQSNGRNKGPYVRRRDRKEYFPRVEKASPPLLNTCLPHPPHERQPGLLHRSTNTVRHPVSGHSFRRVSPDDNSNSRYTSTKEDTSSSLVQPFSEHASSSYSSPNRFPWLLPHFVAGSLIELRDGRLRQVEHLQTEDFLLGSLACPDLRLSCCTVQSISPSASSSSISRLLILLHDQQSQELVDVYVEYPFFVREQGWSSCSPQRTALLCGLQCRQLSVGDVCLALTPVSAPQTPSSVTLEPQTSPRKSEGRCEPIKVSHPQVPQGPQWPAGGKEKKEAETVRRRHRSAPE
ncbi:ataxin-1-like [Toxotes jaculatrix]|uniref:ataxin-1-like n=1 Tax=Toxotes jaculatrix TaxID=941984 RepID=UPI001B3AC1C9|nr:ataxin-1-like [Toxotes jaculatrix]XP_040890144.1 ataxin-1-like [Toxotes jaculatrix]